MIMRFLKKIDWRKTLLKMLYFIPVGLIAFFLLLEGLSRSAALIFNRAMAEQSMLVGTITAEKISADIWGQIEFSGLRWSDPEGHNLLTIPRGNFKVKIWDIIRGNYQATTIEDLAIYDANISLYLNDKMQLDFVRRSDDFRQMDALIKEKDKTWQNKVSLAGKSEAELKEIGRRKRELQMHKADRDLKNFNLDNRDMKMKLLVENCKIEVIYAKRHYLLNRVRAEAKIDTQQEIEIGVRAEGFGGDAIGQSALFNGVFDVSEEQTKFSSVLRLDRVDPSSLGLGKDLHDPLSLDTKFFGTADDIQGTGRISIPTLNIPGLVFSDVKGNIRYSDGKFYFTEVTAKVFDGEFSASGDYDLDTRYYQIIGTGKNLKAERALPDAELSCKVDLNLELKSHGSPRETYAKGDFVSGKAIYHWWWLQLDKISGRFTNAYNDLRFYDVEVDYGPYKIKTDGFSIIDKKLHMEPIDLVDAAGNSLITYDHETKEIISHR